ncbi:hypothetical protein ACWU4D_02120 [Vibrio sp. WJH972]
MSDNIEKEFLLGGSIDKALKGESELKVNAVIRESFSLTVKNFIGFTPAIVTFIAVTFVAFMITLNVLGYSLSDITLIATNPEALTIELIEACFIAVFSAEVICSPLFAGISLMAMSQSAGLKTGFATLLKGFQYTVPIIIVTLLNLIIQAISSSLFGPLSFYFSLAFAHSILLICEKRVLPHNALLISLKATNKKLFPLCILFTIGTILLVMALMTGGIGLIFILPFYMHLKGTIYRNLFGIKLMIVSKSDSQEKSQVFNA